MCILKRASKRQTPSNGFTPRLGYSRHFSAGRTHRSSRVPVGLLVTPKERTPPSILVTVVDNDAETLMERTLYMVVEHFKNKDAIAVYRRFRDKGRMAPEGVCYVSSWVDNRLERCYQLMETHDRRLLDEWMANWKDLVDFEVHVVVTSKEAADKIAPLL